MFRYTKPNPHDGRFDDIDDEDPMEGVEVPEHLLGPQTGAEKIEAQGGAKKRWPFGAGRWQGPFTNLCGDFSSPGMFETPNQNRMSKSYELQSQGQGQSTKLKFFSSERLSTHIVEPNSSSILDSGKFSSNQSSETKTEPNSSRQDSIRDILEKKDTSDNFSSDGSRRFFAIASMFGPKKTPSQNFEIEKYDQHPKVDKIQPDPSSWSPTQFLMRLRHGNERLQRGYYRTQEPMSSDTPKPENHTRFVCISDTHNEHDDIKLPDGDVLLHCGDFTLAGRLFEVDDFNKWLGELPYKHKIVIAGNHELSFDPKIMERVKAAKEKNSYIRFGTYLKPIEESDWRDIRSRLTNCTYVEDNEVTINGIRIWGSPWQPEFGGWGFNVTRGESILEKWDKIPDGIDILMTHGPPAGHGDQVVGGQMVGCVDLLNTIQLRVQPKYHIFGHIHEGYGISTDRFTTYVNCSSVNYHYEPTHKPIVFDLPNKIED